ncbi:hypothetical protein FB45DRAFT_876010 [Roridomyces roridus]|uniref:Uncharacterized protein n=1 Tax=Roridomyces roridus TaxID=1738132 RepID=A0AAD7B539_9AGAR|nr:hypothetical protein FB45DRAFT_876010 [Roridomyces roridus]
MTFVTHHQPPPSNPPRPRDPPQPANPSVSMPRPNHRRPYVPTQPPTYPGQYGSGYYSQPASNQYYQIQPVPDHYWRHPDYSAQLQNGSSLPYPPPSPPNPYPGSSNY